MLWAQYAPLIELLDGKYKASLWKRNKNPELHPNVQESLWNPRYTDLERQTAFLSGFPLEPFFWGVGVKMPISKRHGEKPKLRTSHSLMVRGLCWNWELQVQVLL